ncbi:MAG: gliding motility lipoprotein GldD [Bacteroidetes bacterium HGW-Bacteroidetes-6]|jgi:gliding motility-associated lipoprotein GldD|nr:MAG: gliding motility lipoprotein GldD [Bacteroidetes bacterium HGW-Bacteroidetes-6]
MTLRRTISQLYILAFGLVLFSCGGGSETYYPKPRGFFRIDLPQQEYMLFDSAYPFSFKYPACSHMETQESNDPSTIWFNIVYPGFHGSVNFSYKPVNGNLYELSEDAREFANKHIAKANEIDEIRISNPANRVFGIAYDIEGSNTASPYQFYVTDSTSHYLRAAVYFDHLPNNDSIAPIIQRVKVDMDTLLSSLKWK